MKITCNKKISAAVCSATNINQQFTVLRAALSFTLLVALLSVWMLTTSHAQRLSFPARVSSITTQTTGTGTAITITADGPLTRAQTWQDDEGYHVVVPDTVSADSLKLAHGVRTRRIGSSLEILMQTRPGTRVNVQSSQNEMRVIIDGKLAARPIDPSVRVETTPEERQLFEDPRLGKSADTSSTGASSTVQSPTSTGSTTFTTPIQTSPASSTAPQTQVNSNQIVPQGDGTQAPQAPPSAIQVQGDDESFVASIFSGTSVFIVLGLGLFGLLVSRKLRSKQNLKVVTSDDDADLDHIASLEQQNASPEEASMSLVRASDVSRNGSRNAVVRMPVAGPTSLYGAYRIDQEVGKLLVGQAHRIDVIASRAIDDRRAIETSLTKGVNSLELDETARKRAREALEEYGFVARQCASLLMAPDTFDRVSAARSLGEIKSPAALPFLLESLYDSEPTVRNQAVVSIGELKLPSAIGALLDIARTHPDVPSNLLSRTLSACSLEGLDFFDAMVPDVSFLEAGEIGSVIEQITRLEPAAPVESLPETDDGEAFTLALAALESIDTNERSEALKTLVQFRVRTAVDAIAKVARHDTEPSIRSLAISSLGSINHESVFPTVVIGMADDAREVRAAAARSLNRLSFDRADAYVRVLESGDSETIRNVAKACVQSGIVSQNLDRLTSSDHRQAYETFSLISLLARAESSESVLKAIAEHQSTDVRLKAVHLLACTGEPAVLDQLRELAVSDGIGEIVKTALLEALYKLEKPEAVEPVIVEPGIEPNGAPGEFIDTSFVDVPASPVIDGAFVFNHEESSVDFDLTGAGATTTPDAEDETPGDFDQYEV